MSGILCATCVFDLANFVFINRDITSPDITNWPAFTSVALPLEGVPEFGDRFEPDECACAATPDGAIHVFGLLREDQNVLAYTAMRRATGPVNLVWPDPWRFTQSTSNPDIRPIQHVACAAMPNNDVHLLALTSTGSLFRTVLHAGDSWQPTWSGDFPLPDIRPITDVACTANANGDLHVCALGGHGSLFYATFSNKESKWQGEWASDFPPPDIRPFPKSSLLDRPIACAATPNGDLHFCAVTQEGGLFHTIRFGGGTWQPQGWGNVLAATGVPPSIPGPCGTVKCASDDGGALHVCVVTRNSDPTFGGQLYYALRHASDQRWEGFTNVEADAKASGRVISLGATYVR